MMRITVAGEPVPKVFTSREIIKRLEADGWRLDRTSGSHHIFRHPRRGGIVVVPHPKRNIPAGTLRSVFRQAGWAWPPR